jgi:urea transport system permease protein
VIGALVVNYAKTVFTSGFLAQYWLFMLGALFVLVTLLLPKGIVGTWRAMVVSRRERYQAIAEAHAAVEAKPAE